MTTPSVSILIPAYNAAAFLGETLDSVLEQTYAPLEILVVDDGSTDETPRILEQYRSRGVTPLRQHHAGKARAANLAFASSSGDYVKYLDADDLLSRSAVELQVRSLAGTATHLSLGEWGRFYGATSCTARFVPDRSWADADPIEWFLAAFRGGAQMMQCGAFLIPRRVIETAGGWNESLTLIDDFEFFVRVLLASDGVRFSAGARLYHRSGIPGSLSNTFDRRAAESAFQSLVLGTEQLLKREPSDRIRSICADLFQQWAYRFHPAFPDLCNTSESRSRSLGGSSERLPGGAAVRVLASLFGWRFASNARSLGHRFGWNRIAKVRTRRRLRREGQAL